MVVGGDNLADNQESSMEIYNRLKLMICIADDGGDEIRDDDENDDRDDDDDNHDVTIGNS